MSIITQNNTDEKALLDCIQRFFNNYHVGKILKKCNGTKEKGIPAISLLRYKLGNIFVGRSMYMQQRTGSFKEEFSKNTFYRFLNSTKTNWLRFTSLLAADIINNEKTKFVQKMNSRKENVLQYDIYTKQIAKLQNDVRRIIANKSGLYEDYREQLITAEELCQYQKEYESRVNEIEAQITELLYRRSLYEKDFHIDEGWEETVNKYLSKRKLTRELVEAFVSEIIFTDNNIEVKLLYDDFLKELLEVAEEREVSSNG